MLPIRIIVKRKISTKYFSVSRIISSTDRVSLCSVRWCWAGGPGCSPGTENISLQKIFQKEKYFTPGAGGTGGTRRAGGGTWPGGARGRRGRGRSLWGSPVRPRPSGLARPWPHSQADLKDFSTLKDFLVWNIFQTWRTNHEALVKSLLQAETNSGGVGARL